MPTNPKSSWIYIPIAYKPIILVMLVILGGCYSFSQAGVPEAPTHQATSQPAVGTAASDLTPIPSPSPAPTSAPISTATFTPPPNPTPGPLYGVAFDVDYTQPDRYLVPGEQTTITAEILPSELHDLPPGLEQLKAIFTWLHRDFENWRAGGSTIGAITAGQLIEQHKLGGCHDYGLVFAAAARQLGYPAVMVDAADLLWMRRAAAGKQGSYKGHVFVEVYLEGRWMLIDSTNGWYIPDGYDPANPLLPVGDGFYVIRKGLDTWDYDIHSNQELQQLMDVTAAEQSGSELILPQAFVLRW